MIGGSEGAAGVRERGTQEEGCQELGRPHDLSRKRVGGGTDQEEGNFDQPWGVRSLHRTLRRESRPRGEGRDGAALACSYGYRPGGSLRDAVKALTDELQYGRCCLIVEADIKGFFDNIDHDWMIRMLGERIDDKPFLRLIHKWLKAGIPDTDG